MNTASRDDDLEGDGTPWRRKSFSLPTRLADWVDQKAARGGASAYIAGLIEADRHRELARQELRDFGYAGELEITDDGRARARALLDAQAASRAARDRKHVA